MIGLAVGLQLALASSVQAADDHAAVIRHFGCGLATDASGLPQSLFTDGKTHHVTTPSGNTILKCHFEFPVDWAPAHAQVYRGFGCGTFEGVATRSRSVVTPAGQAVLTCTILHG
jgi:hypothetical protein